MSTSKPSIKKKTVCQISWNFHCLKEEAFSGMRSVKADDVPLVPLAIFTKIASIHPWDFTARGWIHHPTCHWCSHTPAHRHTQKKLSHPTIPPSAKSKNHLSWSENSMLVISGAVSLTLIPTGVVCSNSDDLQLPNVYPSDFRGKGRDTGQGAWCRRTCMERYPDMCPWTGSKKLFVTESSRFCSAVQNVEILQRKRYVSTRMWIKPLEYSLSSFFIMRSLEIQRGKNTHTLLTSFYPQFGWGHISETNSAATPEVDQLAKLFGSEIPFPTTVWMYKTPWKIMG